MPDRPLAMFTLRLSGDQYQGPPMADLTMDGAPLASLAITAVHGKDTYSVLMQTMFGKHLLTVGFANDAFGGTAAADRNLYVDGIYLGDALLPGTTGALYGNVVLTFRLDLQPTPAAVLAGLTDCLADAAAYAALIPHAAV